MYALLTYIMKPVLRYFQKENSFKMKTFSIVVSAFIFNILTYIFKNTNNLSFY